MAPQGSLICQVYTSDARIPVPDAIVTVTQRTATGAFVLLAARLTDSSGRTEPILIETPQQNISTSPHEQKGWTSVDITIDHPGFEHAMIESVQIFPQVRTVQPLEMIPLSGDPAQWNQGELFVIPPQNL